MEGLLLQTEGGGIIGWFLNNPEIGWVGVILYLMWEIRGPYGKINELMQMIKSVITVVRGLARVHDEVDTDVVDEYLVENGMEPGDFISRAKIDKNDPHSPDDVLKDND